MERWTLESLVNSIAEDYRRRVEWIQHQILDMADPEGKVLKKDVESIIYQHYLCSRYAVNRYLETLEGARIITVNSSYLVVEAKKPK